MNLSSSAFDDNQPIPAKYTCQGDNISPQLGFVDVPAEAKSLALIFHDPDAVSGDFTHWLVWNISPSARELAENYAGEGASQGKTDFGRPGYGGPCPTTGTGTHRYIFELYALDTVLDIPDSTTRDQLARAIQGHELASAKLVGLFGS